MRRVLALVAFTILAACTPPAPSAPSEPGASSPGSVAEATTDPLALAAAPAISTAIGVPVALHPSISRTDGEWGWLIAQPWTPEGAAIDWSQTQYAQRAADGALDGDGTTYVLLRQQNGQWTVVASAVGPTDVAWAGWAQQYGAPESLFATN